MKISNLFIIALFSLSSLCARVVQVTSMAQLEGILAPKNSRVIVKFYKDTCPPCKSFAPVYEAVSNDSQLSSITFVEVNAPVSQAISARYSIRSLPTTLFFSNGQLIKGETGFKTASQLRSLISTYFSL
jgi:thioredoxin-like negative regulator of GroEL